MLGFVGASSEFFQDVSPSLPAAPFKGNPLLCRRLSTSKQTQVSLTPHQTTHTEDPHSTDVSRHPQSCCAPKLHGTPPILGFIFLGFPVICARQPVGHRQQAAGPCCWRRHSTWGRAQCNGDDEPLRLYERAESADAGDFHAQLTD